MCRGDTDTPVEHPLVSLKTFLGHEGMRIDGLQGFAGMDDSITSVVSICFPPLFS